MRSLGFLCLLGMILLFVTLALDLHNFGLLTYGFGFILTILAAYFFAKDKKMKRK